MFIALTFLLFSGFFFNDTATTEIYTLPLHDALPISQPSWEDMVVTGRAKSAIRRSLREEHKAAHIRLGAEIARVALGNIGKKATDKALETAAKNMGFTSKDDLLAQIGTTQITGTDLAMALYPELLKKGDIKSEKPSTEVVGLKAGQSHIPGKCCQPLPGERIVGIMVRGRGVVVHTIDCDALVDYENDQDVWIDLRWTEGMFNADHSSTIEIIMANDAGVLGRICTLIGEHNANIANIHFTERKPDYYRDRKSVV